MMQLNSDKGMRHKLREFYVTPVVVAMFLVAVLAACAHDWMSAIVIALVVLGNGLVLWRQNREGPDGSDGPSSLLPGLAP